jgi:hypothetical protein
MDCQFEMQGADKVPIGARLRFSFTKCVESAARALIYHVLCLLSITQAQKK